MELSAKTKKILHKISNPECKLGDLRTIAKTIKKDHDLAEELWRNGNLSSRLLSILIMDIKKLEASAVDKLFKDIDTHPGEQRLQLADWLMANQLTKDKKTVAMMLSWQNNPDALKRRIFWYYQGRLRWTGQKPPNNTKELLLVIENEILNERPEVQWAMNFTAKWIGVFDKGFRNECMKMGEKLGLYKDEVVAKNCSPEYLPRFIEMEVKKRKL